MITADPQKRGARLDELKSILARKAAPEDAELLLAFGPVVYEMMPDRIALGLDPETLAARIQSHFRFVVREMPPAFQLYKGVPGIHVSVRNPTEDEARACGAGQGLPLETTLVQTHTMDAPFIFESLKNYFQKAGLRVFSTVHPIFGVRRQWERIVWIGSPLEEAEAARESFCHFQIERIDSRERLRRIEHEIHSVLKAVFAAVEDFADMVRIVRETGSRLRSRRGEAEDVESARGFLDWLVSDNYILLGSVRYQIGTDGLPDRISESASGVFGDMALLPVVFPGVMEEVEAHLKPAPDDQRIVAVDYCADGEVLYHLEPIDHIVIREWAADGSLVQATLLLGRFAKTAFAEKAADIPPLREKQDWLLSHCGELPNSHAYREIRGVFNRFPKRELFYADVASLKEVVDRIVHMTGDDEIAVHCRRAPTYVALSVAFSRLRYSYKV
jgi:glutamate dehydrogenase